MLSSSNIGTCMRRKSRIHCLRSQKQFTPQGHPTTIFGKISVRKTIWDLEFSELTIQIHCVLIGMNTTVSVRKERTILGVHNLFSHRWKDFSFYVMVTCPNKWAISLPALKKKKLRFSPTIFGLLLLLFDCFLSFSRNNSANTIFWAKVTFRYRASL